MGDLCCPALPCPLVPWVHLSELGQLHPDACSLLKSSWGWIYCGGDSGVGNPDLDRKVVGWVQGRTTSLGLLALL